MAEEAMQQVEENEEVTEVEIPEAETEETEEEIVEEVTNEKTEQETTPEEEIEEYSEGVKKRINKLTYKVREAERREQAAVEYAKGIQEELNKTKNTLSKTKTSIGIFCFDCHLFLAVSHNLLAVLPILQSKINIHIRLSPKNIQNTKFSAM